MVARVGVVVVLVEEGGGEGEKWKSVNLQYV